jgi:hypothetical protein
MAHPRFPYVDWRSGRPRAKHGPRQRALGFVDADLRHPPLDEKGRPIGPWFTLEEAKTFSDKRVAEVAAARISGRIKPQPERKRVTIDHLLDDWTRSDEFKTNSPATQESYRKAVQAILYKPMTPAEGAEFRKKERAAKLLGVTPPARERETIADVTPSSLGRPELRAFYNYIKTERGHHMAIGVIAALSAALTWGQESVHWRLGRNPRIGMEFDHPAGRVVLVTMPEFSAWVAATDAIDRCSIGDSFYLALFTGQRQTDRLAMRDESQVEGRHAFRQSKTGELVDIKEAPQLTTRLSAARARAKAIKLRLQLETVPSEFVIDEDTGQAYDENAYRHWVATTRTFAAFGFLKRETPQAAINRAQRLAEELNAALPASFKPYPFEEDQDKPTRARMIDGRSRALADWMAAQAMRDCNSDESAWRLKPCPSLYFVNSAGELDRKHDQDLRDTCVMLLDRAGCDLLTICDITGHSYKSAQTIVKHYRARNPGRADAGIDRLVLQVRKEGIAG